MYSPKGKTVMKKLLYIGGGSILLLLALLCGAFFASPLIASAQSVSTTPTTSTPTTTTAKHVAHKDIDHPLRVFVRGHHELILDQIAPQLHLSSSQLTQKLQSGESFVKIAKGQGVSVASLKTILVKSVDTVVAQELKAGKITQKHATLLDARVKAHPLVVAHVIHHYYHKK
jgi:hypothetical protein